LIVIAAAPVLARGQEKPATITPPAAIRADGIPSVPAELYRTLNRYQNIRFATFQGWADGDEGMYIMTRFADVPQAHFVCHPGGAREQITFFPERVLSVAARPKHHQFLFTVDEGGAENYQLFLQDLKEGEPRRITDGKSRNTSPKRSPSGELLAWSSNARNGRDMDLYIGAPIDPHFSRRLKEVNGQWNVADWSPDETRVAAVEYISINESYIHLIDISTGKTETLTPRPAGPRAEPVSSQNPKWSKDGKAIYYVTDQAGEFRRLVKHNLASGKVERLSTNDSGDVEDFDLSDDGQRIVWITNDRGSSLIWHEWHEVFGLGVSGPQKYSWFPFSIASGPKFRPGTHEVALTLATPRSPADVYSYNADQPPVLANTRRWTYSEAGGLDTDLFAEPELVKFPTFDNRSIPAFVYRPLARRFPGRRPVLINIHGGPEGQYRPAFLGRLNYLVSDLGLVLIFPNVRGSSGYGKAYLKLDNGKLREGAVKDIGALLEWIGTQPGLDKSRVAVIGGSYGGFMSLAVQTSFNDKIKAGIDIVGISNFVTFLKNTQGYRRDLRRAEYGDERDPEMRSFLERISPLGHAGQIHTPALVVQGQNDPRVPITEAEQMVSALKKNGVPLWYMVGTNEGHGFAKRANQDYLQAVEVLFLKRYLLDR
jgi:dipeptidyl aminopeptidase/acylaminoacyl peptidase